MPTLPLRSALTRLLAHSLGVAGIFAAVTQVAAQTTPPAPRLAADDEPQEAIMLEKFVVTGSAIPVARGQEFQPLTVVTEQDIMLTGASMLPQVLREQPAFFGDAATEQRSNGGTGAAGVNFRGMGGVLVLLDGQRTAAFDEINLIPLIAVDSVEIVKDSAGARYGADALTGVVNVKLISRFRGQRLETAYGNTTDTDAGVLRLGLLTGAGNSRTEIVVGAEYYHRNALMAADRAVSASSDGRSRGGQNLGSQLVSGRTVAQRTPGGPFETLALAPGVSIAAGGSSYVPFDTNPNTSNQLQNTREFTPTIPEQENRSVYARLNQRLLDDGRLDAHVRVLHSHNEYDSAVVSTVASLGAGNVLAAQSPHYRISTGGLATTGFTLSPASTSTTYLRFDSLRRGRRYERDGYDAHAGLSGRLWDGWSWNVTYVYGWWYRDDIQSGAISGAALTSAISSGAYNPFADDSARGVNPVNGRSFDNPAALNASSVTGRIDRDFGRRGVDTRVSGPVFQLPGGPLEVAIGYDHFVTETSNVPDRIITGNFLGFNSTSFSTAEQKTHGIFAETIVPLVSLRQQIPLVRTLSVMASARRSENEIAGTSPGNGSLILSRKFIETTPKFGVRYEPIADLALRATYGRGFRTPGLSTLFAGPSTFSSQLRDPLGFVAAITPSVTTQGNPSLAPEESKSWSTGVVYTPRLVRGLSLEAAYYDSQIENLVGEGAQYILNVNAQTQGPGFVPGNVATLNPNAAFADRITRNSSTGQVTAIRSTAFNIASRETTGLEYGITYVWPQLGGHRLTSRLEANTVLSWDLTPLKGQPSQNWLGRYVNISTNLISPGSIPRHRGRFVQLWQKGDWAANIVVKHVSHLEDDPLWTLQNRPRTIASWTTFDAQLSYTFRELFRPSSKNKLRLDLGLNNATDEDAPYAAAAINDGYDVTLHSNRGRFVYAQVTKEF